MVDQSVIEGLINKELDIKTVDPDPFKQFGIWYEDAVKSQIDLPNAMALSTANKEGKPSGRMVLLKDYGLNGFVFYTNYNSRKAIELTENPYAELVFHWKELSRQVRIEGIVSMLSPEDSDVYFKSRPRESQIAAWASPQSESIGSREELEERFRYYEKIFENKEEIPRPNCWGGMVVAPFKFEFWQGRQYRLHDRIQYTRADGGWLIQRLAP